MTKVKSVVKKIEKHIIFMKTSVINEIISKIKNIIFRQESTKKKIDIKSLTSKEIEEELKRETYKSKYIKVLKVLFML